MVDCADSDDGVGKGGKGPMAGGALGDGGAAGDRQNRGGSDGSSMSCS